MTAWTLLSAPADKLFNRGNEKNRKNDRKKHYFAGTAPQRVQRGVATMRCSWFSLRAARRHDENVEPAAGMDDFRAAGDKRERCAAHDDIIVVDA